MEIEIKNKRYGCLSLVMWFLLVFFAGIVLIGLGSCKSVKYIPVETIKKDSIVFNYVDSIRYTQILDIRDSIRIKDSIVVTKDDKGNITSKESYHEKDHVKQTNDSTSYYRNLLEKYIMEHAEQKPVIVEVEKPLTKWQQKYITLGKVSLGLYIGLVLALIAWVAYRLRKRKIL